MAENDSTCAPELEELIARLDLDSIDLVLVEGFKHVPYTRIELHRPVLGHPLLFPEDDSIIAVAADAAIDTGGLPLLDINNPAEVAEFIFRWLATR